MPADHPLTACCQLRLSYDSVTVQAPPEPTAAHAAPLQEFPSQVFTTIRRQPERLDDWPIVWWRRSAS